MPADFNIAIKVVLANEGGYVNNPADPGGETYKGISRRKWPNWEGWVIIDGYKSNPRFPQILESDSSLQSLVDTFYRHEFWLYGDLNNQDIATKLLDISVNMGIKRAIILCQISLNDIGEHCGVDGKWGPATESTINGSDVNLLLPEIRASQSHYYTNLVAQRPELYQFLKSWLRRVQSC